GRCDASVLGVLRPLRPAVPGAADRDRTRVASLSGMMAWLAGPSKGLLNIGRQYGYLPPYFQKLNEEGIQTHILVAQGVTTTIIGLLYAFIPDVSSAYWIFSVMTTQVYLIMYVLMFIAAMALRRRMQDTD